jgi:hypothetical protein
MNIVFYGFTRIKKHFRNWYSGYTGIMLFGKRFIGFSVHNSEVIIKIDPKFISKPDVGVWIYIFFYSILIEIKNPYKNQNNE